MPESLEIVLALTVPIPALGAEAGDEVSIRTDDPNFPITLRRHLTADAIAHLVQGPVRFLYAEPYLSPEDAQGVLQRVAARQRGLIALAP